MDKDSLILIKKGLGRFLSSNFNSNEFDCKCDGCSFTLINILHVKKLQKLRDKLKKPIEITSGYRCDIHNKKVGGVQKSRHKRGDATDIKVDEVSPSAVANMAEEIGFDGIGIYDTFTHLDSRGCKARWSHVS